MPRMTKHRWHIDIDVRTDEGQLDGLMDRLYSVLDEYDRGGFDLSARKSISLDEVMTNMIAWGPKGRLEGLS